MREGGRKRENERERKDSLTSANCMGMNPT